MSLSFDYTFYIFNDLIYIQFKFGLSSCKYSYGSLILNSQRIVFCSYIQRTEHYIKIIFQYILNFQSCSTLSKIEENEKKKKKAEIGKWKQKYLAIIKNMINTINIVSKLCRVFSCINVNTKTQ